MRTKTFDCYVYQKHVDLHALSAFEAVTQYLGVSQCKKLARFKHWFVTVETDLEAGCFFDTLSKSTYYLCNPNKEIFVTSLPQASSSYTSVFVDVFSKKAPKEHHLIPYLNASCKESITVLEERVTWRCDLDIPTYDEAVKYVQQWLLPSQYQSGILANPLYESYTIVPHKK